MATHLVPATTFHMHVHGAAHSSVVCDAQWAKCARVCAYEYGLWQLRMKYTIYESCQLVGSIGCFYGQRVASHASANRVNRWAARRPPPPPQPRSAWTLRHHGAIAGFRNRNMFSANVIVSQFIFIVSLVLSGCYFFLSMSNINTIMTIFRLWMIVLCALYSVTRCHSW